MAVDRSIAIRLTVNAGQYIAGMGQAAHATTSFANAGQAANTQAAGFPLLARGAAAAAGVFALGIGAAVKVSADFDKAMSGVRANIEATPAQFKKLSDGVRAAGSQFGFSATESAQGAEELAKAGLNVEQIMGGSLNGALLLAAAGEVSVGNAAETAATAMSMFGLGAKDVGHIADVLANGANQSTASVDSLSQALRQGGGVAASFGLSLDDTVATLAMFDQNGLKGSDAGTSLKTMLTALANPSKKAAAMMDELGIKTFDASGKFVGMAALQGILQEKTKGLTQEQRAQAFATIFGSDAMRAANVLMQDDRGFNAWQSGVKKTGTAAENARTRLDNLSGDFGKLKAAMENALISGGGGLSNGLRPLVRTLTDLVNIVNGIPAPVISMGAGFTVAVAGVGLLAAGGVKAVKTFRDVKAELGLARAAMREWSTAVGGSGSVFSGIAAKARAMGSAVMGASTKVKVGAGIAAAAIIGIGIAASQSGDAIENFGRTSATLGSDLLKLNKNTVDTSAIFKDLQIAMNRDQSYTLAEGFEHMNSVLGESESKLGKVITAFGTGTGAASSLDAMKGRLKAVGDELGRMVSDGNSVQAKRAFDQIAGAAKGAGISVGDLKKMMPGYTDALARSAQAAEAVKSPTKKMADAIDGVGNSSEDAQKDVDDLAKAIKGLGSAMLGERDSARGYQAALDDAAGALKENGKNLDITTDKGRKNQAALDGIASATTGWAESVVKSGGSMAQVSGILADGRKRYVEMAVAMGQGREDAERLADSLFALPPGVNVPVALPGLMNVSIEVDKLGRQVYAINGTNIKIPVDAPNAQKIIQALANVKGARQNANGTVTINAKANTAATMTALGNVKGARVDANGNVTIDTKALNTAETISSLQAIANLVKNREQYITTYYQTKDLTPGRAITPKSGAIILPGAQPRAMGGPVYGPGTETSDSIPALLSNNEHVLTASDVRKAGGQPAIYRMRAMIQAGALRFAQGGAVLAGAVQRFASGGAVTPDMSSILALISNLTWDNEKTAWDNLNTAKANADKIKRDLTAARAKLSEDKRKGAPASRIIADQNKVADLLARQLSLQNALNAASSKYTSIKSQRSASAADQFIGSARTATGVTKQFVDDATKIAALGFKPLALSLLNDGSEESQRIARSLASGGIAKIKAANASVLASSVQQDRKQALIDKLTGTATTDAIMAANATKLSLQAANQANRFATGPVRVTVTAPTTQAQAATITPSQVVLQMDGREMGRAGITYQMDTAGRGSSLIGVHPG